MVKRGLGLLVLIFSIHFAYAQIAEPGLPESFSLRTKQARIIPEKALDSLHTALLLSNDAQAGIKNRYGIVKATDVDIKRDGITFTIAGRGRIWQYRIESPNALALGITFNMYLIPNEAKVFIYNDTHTKILGAFTKNNNNENAFLTIADLAGNHAIIEYFEPFNPEFEGQLIIGSVSQAYREISYSTSSAQAARININCPAGNVWQDQKHAICRMIFKDNQYAYYCTGSLINNTSRDGTPYFMSAEHCISNSTNASTLVVFFNFENSTCTSADAPDNQTVSGSKLIANNKYSDFSLVLLNNTPPKAYMPYYLGWNSLDSNSSNGTCIHHPNGTPKCISVDNNPPVIHAGKINWDDTYTSDPNTHWQVSFELGNTEVGSSGSPLLDSNKRIIGQLHGGDDASSFYGKFSLSWNYSAAPESQLKAWLDPISTNETAIEGYGKPISAFKSSIESACIADTIILSDLSFFSPDQWDWTIFPETFQFVNGTDSSSQNPSISFNSKGLYTITLLSKNVFGSDTLIKTNYISVVENTDVSFTNLPVDSTICGCDLTDFKISAQGAVNYSYFLERTDKIEGHSDNENLYLTIKSKVKKEGAFNTTLKVIGSIGSCKSSDSTVLKIVMPGNDDIVNALRIMPGRYTGYSNKCGSAEKNEPYPPLSDCYAQNSWCPFNFNTSNFNADSIINGSLWYTFAGPSNGKINIRTIGSNSRIALYEADSYQNILSANSSRFTILAANDDVSASDKTSLLKNVNVQHGHTYWLQIDGETRNPESFAFEIWSGSIEILPNINSGIFDVLLSDEQNGLATIQIISAYGIVVLTDKQYITPIQNRIKYDMSNFSPGCYIVKATLNGKVLKTKFVKI